MRNEAIQPFNFLVWTSHKFKSCWNHINVKVSLLPELHLNHKKAGDHVLVVGDAAVDNGLLAGVDDNKWKVDDGVWRWGSVCLLLCLFIPLNEVLEGYLLSRHKHELLSSHQILYCLGFDFIREANTYDFHFTPP